MSTVSIGLHRDFLHFFARLSRTEQAQVSRMLEMLVAGQQTPGMRVHSLKGTDFISFSSSMDIRALAVQAKGQLVFVYVDHHDRVYTWAEHHRVVQSDDHAIFELLDVDYEASYVTADQVQQPAPEFGMKLSSRLTSLGYPTDLVNQIQGCCDEDELLLVIESLSPEWQEAIVNIATGADVSFESLASGGSSRVKLILSDKELQEAFLLPLEDWRLFLHPLQRAAVIADPMQSLLIVGGPGTGKSVVLLHRACWLSNRIETSRVVVVLTSGAELIQWMKDEYSKLPSGLPTVFFAEHASLTREGQATDAQISADGFLRTREGTKPIAHILIDEAQDLRRKEIRSALTLSASTGIPLTIALDGNQAIHHTQSFKLRRKLSAVETIHLTYTYRLTRQLADVVKRYGTHLLQTHQILGKRGRAAALSSSDLMPVQYALSGPKPTLITAKDAQGVVVLAERIVRCWIDEGEYSTNELAVVVMPGTANTELLSTLEGADMITPVLRHPTQVKGLEFFAGLILGCDGFLQDEDLETFLLHPEQMTSIKNETVLKLNWLYVALSRFRDQVVVIVTEGNPLKPSIEYLIYGSQTGE